eukprot:8268-Pelagomonas_calceolata.AAC.4
MGKRTAGPTHLGSGLRLQACPCALPLHPAAACAPPPPPPPPLLPTPAMMPPCVAAGWCWFEWSVRQCVHGRTCPQLAAGAAWGRERMGRRREWERVWAAGGRGAGRAA